MKKNENYPKYVQAMRLMDEGMPPWTVCRMLHMHIDTVKRIRKLYLSGGELAMLRPSFAAYLGAEQKEEILLAIKEKGLSLHKAAEVYIIPSRTLGRWRQVYEESGLAGLTRKRSEKAMKKKRLRQRTKEELDELEMLRKRNEYLEAENALLKKVRALVEEKEARLRANGQKPSKN